MCGSDLGIGKLQPIQGKHSKRKQNPKLWRTFESNSNLWNRRNETQKMHDGVTLPGHPRRMVPKRAPFRQAKNSYCISMEATSCNNGISSFAQRTSLKHNRWLTSVIRFGVGQVAHVNNLGKDPKSTFFKVSRQ